MPISRERLGNIAWFLAWATASSAWCVTAAQVLGATFDETRFYLAGGLDFWQTGSHDRLLRVGTMPLPVDVCTLPVHLCIQQGWLECDSPQLLFVARIGTLAFWWLLLFYAGRCGRELGGPWGGRLAIALVAAEPVFLAHASLATTDIAATAALLAFVYHFRAGREGTGWKRIGVPGIWFGVALLTKASALAFAPICMLAVELERLLRANHEQSSLTTRDRLLDAWGQLRPGARDALRIGLLGLMVTFVYCGSDGRAHPKFVAWAHALPKGPTADTMSWVAEHLCIFNNAGTALAWQIGHSLRGHGGTFVYGRTFPRAVWYYFPAALSMKLTVGFLALPLILLLLRPRRLGNWACMVAGLLLLYSLRCNVQIGVRLMLPLIALAAVGLAGALARTWNDVAPGGRRHLIGATAMLAIFWSTLASLHVWPHALCYTNELWGGTDNGFRCLSDSNYDWGQGLPELEAWRRRHAGSTTLAVWYFGSDPTLETLPMEYLPLHVHAQSPEEARELLRGRILAASTTLLHGGYLTTNPQFEIVEYLRRCRPIARTQTFLIYDFRNEVID